MPSWSICAHDFSGPASSEKSLASRMTLCTWIATRAVTKPVAPAPARHTQTSLFPRRRPTVGTRAPCCGRDGTIGASRAPSTSAWTRRSMKTAAASARPTRCTRWGCFAAWWSAWATRGWSRRKRKIPGQPADVCHHTARAQCPARPEPPHRHRPTSLETILKPPCEKSVSAENNCPALRVR